MTDRELLERAARAVGGIEWSDHSDGTPDCWEIEHADGIWREWTPLTDDGDALRLAAKLHIVVFSFCRPVVAICAFARGEDDSHDHCTAVRRAIVRCAAAIPLEVLSAMAPEVAGVNLDLEAMKAAALAVQAQTPPGSPISYGYEADHEPALVVAFAHDGRRWVAGEFQLKEEAKFYADAANPAAVLALIDRLERAEADLASERAANAALIKENDRLQRRLDEAEAELRMRP